jgi:ubiquinone/menaquinone biosynthesis C-methylase UbiE
MPDQSMDDDDIQRFNRWANTYEDSWLQGFLFDKVHRITLDTAVRIAHHARTIVDIGCGTGRLLRLCKARWPEAELIGIDPAPEMIRVAKGLTLGGTFYVAKAEQLPLEDNSADLVLSTLSFHHWHDQMTGLKEITRVLKQGGYFILADGYAPLWLRWISKHNFRGSPDRRLQLFPQAGLKILEQKRAWTRYVVITVGVKMENAQ